VILAASLGSVHLVSTAHAEGAEVNGERTRRTAFDRSHIDRHTGVVLEGELS
jgi:hypothetical protein